jgi:hypothetical protein
MNALSLGVTEFSLRVLSRQKWILHPCLGGQKSGRWSKTIPGDIRYKQRNKQATCLKVTVFWDDVPCNLVEIVIEVLTASIIRAHRQLLYFIKKKRLICIRHFLPSSRIQLNYVIKIILVNFWLIANKQMACSQPDLYKYVNAVTEIKNSTFLS